MFKSNPGVGSEERIGKSAAMIAIVDYDAGNIYSVEKALEEVGAEAQLESTPEGLTKAEKIILPGVGAFGECMKKLKARELDQALLTQIALKKPVLGICVGLQILFQSSQESTSAQGLGIFGGIVMGIKGEKVPHMGWNKVIRNEEMPLNPFLASFLIPNYFYFVHSYHAEPEDQSIIAATTDYNGQRLTAAVARDNVFAVQFHPEKSGDVGLQLLKNFVWRA